MIQYKSGDILCEDAEALVNTVNCVGIMGRGVALQFKDRFPGNFKAYAKACQRGEVQPGRMFVYETGQLISPRYIINFPTKRHWRGKSRIEDIEAGLDDLIQVIKKYNITSIALPPLGSGLGGLDWADVRPRIECALSILAEVRIIVFEPRDVKVTHEAAKAPPPTMTPSRACMVQLIDRYLAALLDPFVTLLEVHKLMYFMQESGEVLRLRYTQGYYGPYSENLRHALRSVEGYFISGYIDDGDKPGRELALVPGTVADAKAVLESHSDTRERLEHVADLVEGFETPFGLELLSTVHWVVTRDMVSSDDDVITRTYTWNEHKRQFSRTQILLALSVLREKGWLPKTTNHAAPYRAD
jgi:O-acetyl-ADP-ribose deacetylase (regulator of RNase III)